MYTRIFPSNYIYSFIHLFIYLLNPVPITLYFEENFTRRRILWANTAGRA